MEKRKFSRIIAPLLVAATLLTGHNSTVQAESLDQYAAKAYNLSSSLVNNQQQTLNPSWGLGNNQTEYVSNNRSYNWYIDQGNTGAASNNNCGPCSVTMALKWSNFYFFGTAESARNLYPKNGGWWYTNDITNYLNLCGGSYSVQAVDENTLKSNLKQGNIAILCINTSYIPYNKNEQQRVGRFYNYAGGHFLVVKGYRVVDNKTYFEVYDSNNWNSRYQDGQEKGKDRYYLSRDLTSAANNWWNNSIIVQPFRYYRVS